MQSISLHLSNNGDGTHSDTARARLSFLNIATPLGSGKNTRKGEVQEVQKEPNMRKKITFDRFERQAHACYMIHCTCQYTFFFLIKEGKKQAHNCEVGVRMGFYGMALLRAKPTALKYACRCHQYPYISSRHLLKPQVSCPHTQVLQGISVFSWEVILSQKSQVRIHQGPTFIGLQFNVFVCVMCIYASVYF